MCFGKVTEARGLATHCRSQVVRMPAQFPRTLKCHMGVESLKTLSSCLNFVSCCNPYFNWGLCRYLGKIHTNSLYPSRKRWPSFLVHEPNLAHQKQSQSYLVSWKVQFYIGCPLTSVILLCMRIWLEDHDYNLFPYSYHWIVNVCISWLT